MIKRLFCKNYFCVDWSGKSLQIINSVKNKISQNPNYVKDNAVEVIYYLSDLIDRSEWKNANKFLKQVDTTVINKWSLWYNLSQVIDKKLDNINHIDQSQISNLSQMLSRLRYEPSIQKNEHFYSVIKQLVQQSNYNLLKQIPTRLILTFPELFIQYRSIIEDKLINKLKNSQFQQLDLVQFSEGIITNLWSKEFLQQFSQILVKNLPKSQKIAQKLLNYTQLPNLAYETKITKARMQKRSNTQQKIGEMLRDVGYLIRENILINDLEVDFMIGDNIVLEYNGMMHYKINQKEPSEQAETKYERWRLKSLMARGLHTVSIPFYQWEKIQNEKKQKIYLIQKIQNYIISIILSNKKKENIRKQKTS